MEESWDEIQRWLIDVFNWAGVDAIEAEELAVVPGLDEVFALGDIKTYAESGEWDTLVVDCAPTAETIRLLSLPDILSWYMERVFPAGRRVNRMIGPVLSRVTNLPVAGDEVFGATRRFYDRLDGVKEVLSDREPHQHPPGGEPRAHGDRRGAAHLHLPVAVRLPGRRGDRQPAASRRGHRSVVRPVAGRAGQAHDHDRPRRSRPCRSCGRGWPTTRSSASTRLRRFAEEVYDGVDPLAVLHDHDPLEIVANGDARVLILELPFADRDDSRSAAAPTSCS